MNPSQMNTTQLKEFVQLGQAAYAAFPSAPSTSSTIVSLTAAPNGPFAEGEAQQFTERYSVLTQSSELDPSGFSATVFQDKANPNRVILIEEAPDEVCRAFFRGK